MPVRKYAHFCVTVNNYTDAMVSNMASLCCNINNRNRVTYICFQREQGASGTPHLQMYFQTVSKIEPKKFTDWLAQRLGVRPHVEGAKGSSEQCVDYCSKDDTRVPDTETVIINPNNYAEIAATESRQGAREDLEAVRTAIHDGASLADLVSEHFDTFARYDRFLRQYYTDHHQQLVNQQLIDSTSGTSLSTWQTDLMALITCPPPPRKISWWWESTGGVGKSFMARHLVLHHDAVLVQLMKKADMLHLLTKQIRSTTRCVVFDLTRSSEAGSVTVIYETLEMLSNQFICSGKYDSQSLHIPLMHLIVFSNYEPDRSAMSADRWDVHHIINND